MEYAQQMVAAAAVVGLLGALLWYLRKRGWAVPAGRGGAQRRLQILERLPLAPQHTLHLVRVGDEALLVACSPGACTLLEKVPMVPAESGVRR